MNVGCHSDAHEQAKWFGDDIALKSNKYRYDARSLRMMTLTMRRLGAGNPPLHRLRVGLAFALSGHREVDGMLAQHSALARSLADELGLSTEVQEGIGGAYERWDGHGWPQGLGGEDSPLVARVVQVAEFVEVAHRLGGTEAAVAMARRRSGKQFDPRVAALVCSRPETIFAGLESVGSWSAVIDAEPSLAVVLSGERFDAALEAIANFVDIKSPYTLGHSRAVGDLAAEAGRTLGLRESEVRLLRRAGPRARLRPAGRVELDLGQARSARRRRVGARADAPLPHRAHAPGVAGAARPDRRAAARAPRRLGLPARALGRRDLPPARAYSAPPTPIRRCASRGRTARRASPMTRPRSCGRR